AKAADRSVAISFTARKCQEKTHQGLRLGGVLLWRRDPESNRARRICNPLHNRFAIAPWSPSLPQRAGLDEKREAFVTGASLQNLERETRLELATSTLARLRSTN